MDPAEVNYARFIAWGLLVVLSLPLSTSAQSLDPSSLSAEERSALGDLFTAARTAYEAGNYLEAIESLERAHDIFPEPNILYRIGDAYESAGMLVEAIAAYREYLAAAPQAKDRGIVSRRVQDLERRVAAEAERDEPPAPTALVLDSKPLGAVIEIDGVETGSVTPARLAVEPGAHRIVLRSEGFEPLERELHVEAGETLSLVYALDPVAAPSSSSPWPWVLVGTGLAGLGVSGGLLGVSAIASSRVEVWDAERDEAFDAGEPLPPRPAEYDATLRRSIAARRAAFVGLGMSAAAMGGGIVWLSLRKGSVALVPGPRRVDVVVRF